MIAKTPEPPYYAVIFTSIKSKDNRDYAITSKRMIELAKQAKGFLGAESAREGIGITVSYWDSLKSINEWKMNTEHRLAQKRGKEEWYSVYKIRICKVERDYGF